MLLPRPDATAPLEQLRDGEVGATLAVAGPCLDRQGSVQRLGASDVACARIGVGGSVARFLGVARLVGQPRRALVVFGGFAVPALARRGLGGFRLA